MNNERFLFYNLKGLLDNIKGNTHKPELKRLEFHAIWDIDIFHRQLVDNVEWFYLASKYLFKPMVRISGNIGDLWYFLFV